jgi:hypothetical protein
MLKRQTRKTFNKIQGLRNTVLTSLYFSYSFKTIFAEYDINKLFDLERKSGDF